MYGGRPYNHVLPSLPQTHILCVCREEVNMVFGSVNEVSHMVKSREESAAHPSCGCPSFFELFVSYGTLNKKTLIFKIWIKCYSKDQDFFSSFLSGSRNTYLCGWKTSQSITFIILFREREVAWVNGNGQFSPQANNEKASAEFLSFTTKHYLGGKLDWEVSKEISLYLARGALLWDVLKRSAVRDMGKVELLNTLNERDCIILVHWACRVHSSFVLGTEAS